MGILNQKGLSEKTIRAISFYKKEPEWMLKTRLAAYRHYTQREEPTWGAELSDLKDENIQFFAEPKSIKNKKWEDVPVQQKEIFDRLKIPEAEQKFLAGVETQFDSSVVYGRIKEKWEGLGVIFTDTDTALKEYPDIFKKYFGRAIPFSDNKYAALNTACWSGGSFVYVPKGVKLDIPLQAYFYIQQQNLGQFERTLIIADEDSEVSYVEGCTAPTYQDNILHSGVIELIALKNAKIRYTTIQNWSKNVYNLVTQRGVAHENAKIEWIDCNIGSKVTMKYPSVYLRGDNSRGEILSLAVADGQQHIDSGAKLIHIGKNTSGIINTKSISKNGGRCSYRGLVKIAKGATRAKAKVTCDALILDDKSQTDTYPYNEVYEEDSEIEHEASVSQLSEDKLYYLQSKGLSTDEASALIVSGFINPISKELPMEYAMEMNELIKMSMEGSVG